MVTVKHLYSISLYIILSSSILSATDEHSCACDPVAVKAALIDLYNSANGPNWDNPWDLSLPPSMWNGVGMDVNQCVGFLNLFQQGLVGSIPNSIGDLNYASSIVVLILPIISYLVQYPIALEI